MENYMSLEQIAEEKLRCAESARRSAARRLSWIEHRAQEAETLEEFERWDMEAEKAEADVKAAALAEVKARSTAAGLQFMR